MILVKDMMSKNPVFVKPKDLVTKARGIMRDFGYRALPVLENDKIIGIVTRADILRITSSKANVEIGGIMKKEVITTTSETEIFSVIKEITKRGIRQLPVIDNGKLVGIISSMDILRGLFKNKHTPTKSKVEEIMTKEVIFCNEEDELSKVWEKIYERGFSGLPVLRKGKVVGMITRSDIIKHGSIRLSKESGRVRNVTMKTVMRTPALVIKPETKISDAVEMMCKRKISRLPVVNDEKNKKLLGIVDVQDILKAYL